MDVEVLRQRQSAVSFFVEDINLDTAAELRRALRGVKYISSILKRLRKSQASVGDWSTLSKTVCSMVQIVSILRMRNTNIKILEEMGKNFSDELGRIGKLMTELLDLQEMQKENRFVVNHGIDPELDERKEEFERMPEFLSAVARKEFRGLKSYFDELSVLYLPMLGYMICVPTEAIFPGVTDHLVPGLDFVFRTTEQVHYKSPVMVELDETIGDVKFQIIDMETSMMLRLQDIILESAPVLLSAVRTVAQLDCLLALAHVARELEWVRPELVEDSVIEVEDSWHPLLVDVSMNAVVSNPVKSGGEHGRIKILMGPNASGKSVYLKQVGVVAFLAHVGSFVPAKKAKIGVLDRIFTRMHSGDSVLDGYSTFYSDLKQMAVALRRATGLSLVIVDEFGKGTISDVGVALLVSGLKYWRESKNGCPHVFLCSHFHNISTLIPETDVVRYQAMDVLRQGPDLVFVYKLVDGTIGCSYAAYTALVAGLPEQIVQRGYQVYNCLKMGDPIRRSDADSKIVEKQFKRWDLEKNAQGFLTLLKKEIDKQEKLANEIPRESRKEKPPESLSLVAPSSQEKQECKSPVNQNPAQNPSPSRPPDDQNSSPSRPIAQECQSPDDQNHSPSRPIPQSARPAVQSTPVISKCDQERKTG